MGSRRVIAGLLLLARVPLIVLVEDPAAAGATPAVPPPPPTLVVGTRADDGSPQSLRGVLDMVNADGGPWRIELLAGEPYVLTRLCQSGLADDNHGGDLDITTNANVAFVAAHGTQATIAVG